MDASEFWDYVDMSSGPDACWEWTRGRDAMGYGHLILGGKNLRAHRVAMMLSGKNVSNAYVCHTCDNPPCCNPLHLFLGTQTDNMRDCVSKGRHSSVRRPDRVARGDRHGMATHSEKQIITIRAMLHSGMTCTEVAESLGEKLTFIRLIKDGQSWRHLGGRVGNRRNKLSEEQVDQLRRLSTCMTGVELASMFEISRAQVSRIVNMKQRCRHV